MIYLLKRTSGDCFDDFTFTEVIGAYYLEEEVEEEKDTLEAHKKQVEDLEFYLGESDSLDSCIAYELCRLTGETWLRGYNWFGDSWTSYEVVEIELI